MRQRADAQLPGVSRAPRQRLRWALAGLTGVIAAFALHGANIASAAVVTQTAASSLSFGTAYACAHPADPCTVTVGVDSVGTGCDWVQFAEGPSSNPTEYGEQSDVYQGAGVRFVVPSTITLPVGYEWEAIQVCGSPQFYGEVTDVDTVSAGGGGGGATGPTGATGYELTDATGDSELGQIAQQQQTADTENHADLLIIAGILIALGVGGVIVARILP
jgi:hypothetical protein